MYTAHLALPFPPIPPALKVNHSFDLIEKYTINVKYIEHKIKETTNSCIYLYIIIFMLFILGLVYFLF